MHYFTCQWQILQLESMGRHSVITGSQNLWCNLAGRVGCGSFARPPQKTHYPFHIYILFNICQTFINYKLMKCSTVFTDHTNEGIYLSSHGLSASNDICISDLPYWLLWQVSMEMELVTCHHLLQVQSNDTYPINPFKGTLNLQWEVSKK